MKEKVDVLPVRIFGKKRGISNVNYVFNTSQNILNSGYTKYQVKDRIDNIRSIKLVTFEIPVLFLNIRTGSTSTFSFILNTVTYIWK